MNVQRGVAAMASVLLVCAVSATLGANPVSASNWATEIDDTQAVAASIDSVSTAAVTGVAGSGADAVVPDAGPTTIAIPKDPARGIEMQSPTGVEVGIGLPNAANANDATIASDGTVVYSDAAPGVSVAAQALADGSVSALVVIASNAAPTEYGFPIGVPAGGRLELQADSSVNVLDGNGDPAGHFDAPWAKDNAGNPIATSYRIDGTTLVQSIAHSSNYPVVADPHYTWGWVTGTVYYGRSETRSMKTLSYAGVVAGGLCAVFGPETLGAACVISGAFYAQWNYVAGNAYGDGKCVKIKVPTFWASAYSGGDCK